MPTQRLQCREQSYSRSLRYIRSPGPAAARRLLRTAAVLGCLGFLIGSPQGTFADHQIKVRSDLVALDLEQYHETAFCIFYPVEEGVYPLVVFSHGYRQNPSAGEPLGRYWAKNGIISIFPRHKEPVTAEQREDGRLRSHAFPLSRTLPPVEIQHRLDDCALILDSLPEIQRSALPPGVRIDEQRIGVGGHAQGSMVAQLLGGTVLQSGGETTPKSFKDERPRAFLLISPHGEDNRSGLREDAWDDFSRPMLVVTGALDRSLDGREAAWRRHPFERSPPGDKFLLWFEQGTHHAFTASPETINLATRIPMVFLQIDPEEQEKIHEVTARVSLQFWQAFLSEDQEEKKNLNNGVLGDPAGTTVELLRRK